MVPHFFDCVKIDGLVKSRKMPFSVIPAKAEHVVTRSEALALTFSAIQSFQAVADDLDSGFHRSDDFLRIHQNCITLKNLTSRLLPDNTAIILIITDLGEQITY